MFRLTFLGTAGSVPTKDRNLPSVALEYEGETFLLDCGEGTQRQFLRFALNPWRIKSIFITHMHGDHFIGIAGLIRTLGIAKRTTPLRIYVPKGEENKVKVLLTFDEAIINYPIIIQGIGTGVVTKGKGYTISAFRLNHSLDTYGYVFKEDDKVHFLKEKCNRLGIKGAMFSTLAKRGFIKAGKKTIRLKDVSNRVPGRKVVYATDTRPCATTVSVSKDADILIHESAFSDTLRDVAKERMHSTAVEAAGIAKKAMVKKLILFHTSARYPDAAPLLKEAKEIFNNSVLAKDGMQIDL
jgi:ribonuclease Z